MSWMKLLAVCLPPTEPIKRTISHVHSELTSLLHCSRCWGLGTGPQGWRGLSQGPVWTRRPHDEKISLGGNFFHPPVTAWTLSSVSRKLWIWRRPNSTHWKDPLFPSSRQKASGCGRSYAVPGAGTCLVVTAFHVSVTVASVLGFPPKKIWIQNNW